MGEKWHLVRVGSPRGRQLQVLAPASAHGWLKVRDPRILKLLQDRVSHGNARRIVVHEPDQPLGAVVRAAFVLAQLSQVAHHAGVGVVLELLAAVVLGPALADPQDQLVLVHAVSELVSDQLVRVVILHKLGHVILRHPALLDVLAGGVKASRRRLREARCAAPQGAHPTFQARPPRSLNMLEQFGFTVHPLAAPPFQLSTIICGSESLLKQPLSQHDCGVRNSHQGQYEHARPQRRRRVCVPAYHHDEA